MKKLIVLAALMALTSWAWTAPRLVVFEEMTATW